MKINYDPEFLRKLKKVDVRISRSLKKRIEIFIKNPNDPQLKNHLLKDEYEGYKSIDITADWRAIYEEIEEEEENIAYFFLIGTHKKLYRKTRKK